MARALLFCIAEEAKTFVPKALGLKRNYTPCRLFWLVETHTLPSDSQGFKSELKDNEIFETDFIGASIEDCQKWALEKQYQVNFIDQNFIAVADARSARDDTLLMQYYSGENILEIEGHGDLPRESNTWYNFRIDQSKADLVFTALTEINEELTYPVYFECKDELTDEYGVFNADKAQRLAAGKEPDS
ncbi:MAG: hypothetical protein Q9165_007502 [Trypethelium subeluteriae]